VNPQQRDDERGVPFLDDRLIHDLDRVDRAFLTAEPAALGEPGLKSVDVDHNDPSGTSWNQ
jgi:hypothetical protein